MTYPPTTIVQLMPQQCKSRYQKQYRNATFGLIRLLFMAAWFVLALIGKIEAANAAPPLVERLPLAGTFAATVSVQTSAPVVYLLPDASTAVRLQTHTADFRVINGPDSAISVSYSGLYRLKNETEELVTVPLILVSDSSDAQGDASIDISANGLPLALEGIEDELRTEVKIAPDTSLDIRVDYAVALEDAPLALLRYDARRLAAWPGNPSLRTTIVVPDAIGPESWVRVEPEDLDLCLERRRRRGRHPVAL